MLQWFLDERGCAIVTREEVAAILTKSRSAAGFTQKQAAEAIGRPQQTLASWETGKSQPDVNTLFALFDVYGISVDEAFGFNDKPWSVTGREFQLIRAYRSNPKMQEAVDRLLGLAPVAADMEAAEEIAVPQRARIGDFTDTDYVRSVIDAQEEADKRHGKKGNAARSG